MIRILVSVVGFSFFALTSASVSAQSLSLYGEIDSGLAYVSNVDGHAQYRATSGLIDGSFWGLQGTEDLGGGATALFRLEHGYSANTGNGFNDHPAYVGLQAEPIGTLTLGHQYDTIHDYFAPFVLTGGTGGTGFAHPFDNDNANNSYLASNAMKYASASFGGFSFGGIYAFSNRAGGFAQNRAYGAGVSYSGGGLNAGAAWMRNDGRGLSSSGAYDPLTMPGTDAALISANVRKQNTIGAGASYAIGDVTVAGAWSRAIHNGVTNADDGTPLPSIAFSNYELNAIWQVTPAFSLAGMYVFTNASSAHWHEGAVQSVYQLSKRTDVYAEAIVQRASNGVNATINTNDPSSGRNQMMVAAGIRHHF